MFPDFLQETAWIRASSWKVAPTPADLLDRRVEITGPPIRKMLINAMNCGATGFMVDFEDASMFLNYYLLLLFFFTYFSIKIILTFLQHLLHGKT